MTELLDAILAARMTLSPAAVAGALGVAANCVWPLLESRRQILAVQVLSAAMFGLHYLFLGAPTAAAMCASGGVQALAAATLRRNWARGAAFGATIAAGVAIAAATWSGVASALALSGQSMSAFGRLQSREQAIRLAFLGSEVFWTAHNTLVGSAWGLTSDAMSVTMLLVGLWRGGWGKQARPGALPLDPAKGREALGTQFSSAAALRQSPTARNCGFRAAISRS